MRYITNNGVSLITQSVSIKISKYTCDQVTNKAKVQQIIWCLDKQTSSTTTYETLDEY